MAVVGVTLEHSTKIQIYDASLQMAHGSCAAPEYGPGHDRSGLMLPVTKRNTFKTEVTKRNSNSK